jgi:hypothetical protein
MFLGILLRDLTIIVVVLKTIANMALLWRQKGQAFPQLSTRGW